MTFPVQSRPTNSLPSLPEMEYGQRGKPGVRWAIMNTDWNKGSVATYERGIAAWNAGRITAATMFDRQDAGFLAEIGCTTQELFDFIEDERRYGEPDLTTALEVAAIRRDYFLNVLKGKP